MSHNAQKHTSTWEFCKLLAMLLAVQMPFENSNRIFVRTYVQSI